MGASTEYYNELNKLKKEVLIDIIIKKCVPESLNLSRDLRNFINKSDEGLFLDPVCEVRQTNLQQDLKICKLEGEIRALQTEVSCSRTLVSALEKTIQDKEEIILLLKNVNNCSDLPNLPSVAGLTNSSAEELKNKSTVSRRAEPRSRMLQQGTSLKRPIVVGDRESDSPSLPLSFASAARKAWLYVGRADKNTTPEQIKKHLKDNFPSQDFIVESLPVRDNANSIAFKVGADISLIDDLNTPDLWPKGIIVKRYRFFRRSSRVSE